MIPVYYFDEIPEKLPEDDACYIVSKYIYLKKRSGLIDSMVKVDSIDMATVLPEYAKMNLPKIKAKVFGQVQGFFRMVYGLHRSEAGVILNLHTHPQRENLKRVGYTVPHQRVSGGGCKYQIVIDPSYINCGTIHSHANFGAFHSGTDVNDERYFDGLHITVGHNAEEAFSISACVVVNGKRIKVNPLDYIDGIKDVGTQHNNDFYEFIDPSMIVQNENHLKFVTALAYTRPTYPSRGTIFDKDHFQKVFGVDDEKGNIIETLQPTVPCKECIFKEIKLEDELDGFEFEDDSLFLNEDDDEFSADDRKLFEDRSPLFKEGEIDEDGIQRSNKQVPPSKFFKAKEFALKKNIKCECGTTFFVEDPEIDNACPACERISPAQTFTYDDFLSLQKQEEWLRDV